jgi:hypothetical protein
MLHWLNTQWFLYWWPSDKGNGPENIQWTVLALIVASLLIPRVRKFFKRHFESVHEKLDHHHEMVLQQNEAHHEEAMRQAEEHHKAHLAAIGAKPGPKRDAKGHFTK